MAANFDGDPIRQSMLYVQCHERKALGEAYVGTFLDTNETNISNPTYQHWALVLTDVEGDGATLHHCTDRSGKWEHEVKPLNRVLPTANTLCLAGIGSIPETRRAEAEKILDEIEIMPVGSKVASGEPFNCRTWLKMAVGQLDRARVIRLIGDVGM